MIKIENKNTNFQIHRIGIDLTTGTPSIGFHSVSATRKHTYKRFGTNGNGRQLIVI